MTQNPQQKGSEGFINKFVAYLVKNPTLGIAIVLIVIAGVVLFSQTIIQRYFSLRRAPEATWNNIVPGQTTLEDTEKLLGPPLESQTVGDQTILSYQSTYPVYPNHVYTTENKVTFIKEWIDPKDTRTLAFYTEKFGEPEFTAYSNDSSDAYYLYVFPKQGIAVNAHIQEKKVFHVWYFEPTTQEAFIKDFKEFIHFTQDGPE